MLSQGLVQARIVRTLQNLRNTYSFNINDVIKKIIYEKTYKKNLCLITRFKTYIKTV